MHVRMIASRAVAVALVFIATGSLRAPGPCRLTARMESSTEAAPLSRWWRALVLPTSTSLRASPRNGEASGCVARREVEM